MGFIDVAVVGAGPYGLSLAAHLGKQGVKHRIFGSPMYSWLNRMPSCMFLKSEGFASNLADPDHALTLKRFCLDRGYPYRDYGSPIPRQVFCEYGLSFQRRFAPDVEDRTVALVESLARGFALHFTDGGYAFSRKVVMCSGIEPFRNVPESVSCLPPSVVSHTSDHSDYCMFAGKDVCVLGGGASATDAAAALHKAGARVYLVSRAPTLKWTSPTTRPPLSEWWHMRDMLGAGRIGQGHFYSQAPQVFHKLPDALRTSVVNRFLGPRGGWPVRECVEGLPKLLGFDVASAEVVDGHVRLGLTDGRSAIAKLQVDHIVAGTGYLVDLRRLNFLSRGLIARVTMAASGTAPRLTKDFESSVPGLYFSGVTAANAFGPLLRFVAGARFASERISARLAALA